MQFAGQRTDMDLKPVGEPFNILIKLTPDVLPDPEAILLTGITPQQTLVDGITEVEFLKIFESKISTPNTIFVGYNSVRFDDEFMRSLRYRNFYDPYDWQWRDGRSRWDLLDVVRMMRALRPDGIKWPVDDEGKTTNRLELLTKLNGLDHEHAHDALNDVLALITLAELIRKHQPKLFDWLLQLRSKQAVKKFLEANPTFVYTSNKYPSEYEKTSVVQLITLGDDKSGAIVYDLRVDPQKFAQLSPKQLAERWHYTKDPDAPPRLPVKSLKMNRCPAIGPTGLIADETVQKRLGINLAEINKHKATLAGLPQLKQGIIEARRLLDAKRETEQRTVTVDVDAQLYEGFLDNHDDTLLRAVRSADPAELVGFRDDFHDTRMHKLLPRYQARNYPDSLTAEERKAWDEYIKDKLFSGGDDSRLAQYFKTLATCAADPKYKGKQFLLEELQLYGQSLMPSELDS